MELFAHKFVANGERKTYLRLSGRFKFLKPLNLFEKNMKWVAVKGQPLVTKFFPVVFCL